MYTVYFNDRVNKFYGGEPNNSKWLEIPNYPITKIEYKIKNRTIVAFGYEAYNHEVEHCSDLLSGNDWISAIILSLKHEDSVTRLRYNFRTNKVTSEIFDWECFKLSGWKSGIKGQGNYIIK